MCTSTFFVHLHYRNLCYNNTMRKQVERHGLTKSPEYRIWAGIKARCNNPGATHYDYYGGRGIIMCDRWQESFLAFLNDVGERPSNDWSIDRIDTNGNYEPGNVKWSLNWVQRVNRRKFTNNTSGYRGVSKNGRKWLAQIKTDGRKIHLGNHPSARDAALVYNGAAIALWGDNAIINDLRD